jgi:rRNA maturation protein Nop10
MEKQQKFFCEFCKSEVPQNATTCAVCGRTFAAVKCPKCGKTGTADEFSNGCPFCGYAAKVSVPIKQSTPEKRGQKKFMLKKSDQLNTWLFYGAAVVAIGGLAGLLFVL